MAPLVYESGELEVDLARRELRAGGVHVPIGARAFEIVETLVETAGRLVTKDDIIERVWRGAVVEENALQVHISSIRKSLGKHRDVLQTVSGRGYRLIGAWVIQDSKPPAETRAPPAEPVVAAAPRANLPAATSSLIGRAAAVKQLVDLTANCRAVTLTGPGGIGKTSLALEVARYLAPAFHGDAWLVELASLTSPDLLPSAIARVLGLKLGGDDISSETVARAVGDRKLLLILDNCEHLIDAAADFAETMLRRCARLSIVATSREVLRIDGEFAYRVPPLDVPPLDHAEPEGQVRHGAMQLFIARATATNSDFTLDRADVAAVANICRQLDGIPLAIEFAAARAATLGVGEVARRLDDRLGLLTGGRRTALPRHRTLRAALDWSYELLPPHEQRLLCQLGAFAGGFTIEAASAVAAEPAAATLDNIVNLVSKSLVAPDIEGGRWRLLDTIRAYALEKLDEAGEAELAARRHAEYFRDLVAPMLAATKPSAGDLSRFAREIDNVRAALTWSFAKAGDTAVGVMLTAAYAPVFLHLTLMVECRDNVERALQRCEAGFAPPPAARMQMLIALGVALIFTMGSVERIRIVVAEAVTLTEAVGSSEDQLRNLWSLWTLQFNIGECRAALATADRFAAAARRADPGAEHVAERIKGNTLQYLGQQRPAEQCFRRVLGGYIAPAGQQHTAAFHYEQHVLARSMLARALWMQGRLDQAVAHAEGAVADAVASGHELSLLYPLAWTLFPINLATGRCEAARDALKRVTELGDRYNAAFWKILARCLAAKLAITAGEFAAGSTALRAALAECDRSGWTICYPEFLAALAEGEAGLGDFAGALSTIDRGIAWGQRGGEAWYLPELYRLKGEMLLNAAERGARQQAERCFGDARDLACEQGALFWELRAAVSLFRLKRCEDAASGARQLLAAVYERFEEGFDAADLREAKALLQCA